MGVFLLFFDKKIKEINEDYKEYAGMSKERSIAIDLIDILEDKLSERGWNCFGKSRKIYENLLTKFYVHINM